MSEIRSVPGISGAPPVVDLTPKVAPRPDAFEREAQTKDEQPSAQTAEGAGDPGPSPAEISEVGESDQDEERGRHIDARA